VIDGAEAWQNRRLEKTVRVQKRSIHSILVIHIG